MFVLTNSIIHSGPNRLSKQIPMRCLQYIEFYEIQQYRSVQQTKQSLENFTLIIFSYILI